MDAGRLPIAKIKYKSTKRYCHVEVSNQKRILPILIFQAADQREIPRDGCAAYENAEVHL